MTLRSLHKGKVHFPTGESASKGYEWHLYSHSIVLVDLNEFSSIFQKVQHSHSRHQKTTSKSQFKRQIKVWQWFTIRGSYMYVHKPMVIFFGGMPPIFVVVPFPQNIDGFRQNDSQCF